MSIDLKACRDRLQDLGRFNDVGDSVSAGEAMTNFIARPPSAYVSTASERAGPNKLSTGWRQRIFQTVSVLFVVGAERRDAEQGDEVEAHRLAIFESFTAWTPPGADGPFQYIGYSHRFAGDGLIWGESLFGAPYYFQKVP